MKTETGVQQFWEASLAWKRVPGFVEGISVGRLFEILHPLEHQTIAPNLRAQAGDLSDQIVKGRCRRKKTGGKVVTLSARHNKAGHESKAA
jgi:hypothetical protein